VMAMRPSRPMMVAGMIAPCTMPRRCSTEIARAICVQAWMASGPQEQVLFTAQEQAELQKMGAFTVRSCGQAVPGTR
jgi:hypothetical protein